MSKNVREEITTIATTPKPKITKAVLQLVHQLREDLAELEINSKNGKLKKREAVLVAVGDVLHLIAEIRGKIKGNNYATDLRATLKHVTNVLNGTHDGIEDKTMGIKSFRSTIHELNLKVIKGGNSKLVPLSKQIKAGAEKVVPSAVDGKTKTDVREEKLESRVGEHRRMMRIFEKYQAKLPATLRTSYDVISMPVVPVFDDFNIVTDKSLSALHIKHKSFEGLFHVLEEQQLLVFRKDEATTYTATMKSGKTRVKQAGSGTKVKSDRAVGKQTARQKLIQNHITDIIANEINPALHVEYTLVSVHFPTSPKNKNIMFAWIMRKDKLKQLERAANENNGLRGNWGFPWDFEKTMNGDV